MPAPTAADIAASDAVGEPLRTQGVCHTRVLIESLPAPAQAAIAMALYTPSVKSADIVRVLESHDLPVRAENFNRHRRRFLGGRYACKCPLPLRETDAP